MPTGRLRKKIARQSTALVRMPPSTGPAASAIPPTAAQVAIPFARAPGSANASRTRASEEGSSSAAATPCSSRAPIRTPIEGAAAQASEAMVKAIIPAEYTRETPIRSPSAPLESNSAAKVTT